MATEQDFLKEQEKFNQKYGIDLSIKDYQNRRKVFQNLDMFASTQTRSKNEPLAEYVDTLQVALSKYMESQTRMESEKEYSLYDFSIQKFIEDFDRVMQMKHESELKEGEESTYTRYAGANLTRLADRVVKEVGRRFDKTLGEVWADNLEKGYSSMEQMKAITEQAEKDLDGVDAEDLNEKQINQLGNIVTAKVAMEKLRESRGFWWKVAPWNWSRNSQEKQYLQELTEKVQRYDELGYAVGAFMERANAFGVTRIPTLLGTVKADLERMARAETKTIEQTEKTEQTEKVEEKEEELDNEPNFLDLDDEEEEEKQIEGNEEEKQIEETEEVASDMPEPVVDESGGYRRVEYTFQPEQLNIQIPEFLMQNEPTTETEVPVMDTTEPEEPKSEASEEPEELAEEAIRAITAETKKREKAFNDRYKIGEQPAPKKIPEGKRLANKDLMKIGYIPDIKNVEEELKELNQIKDYLFNKCKMINDEKDFFNVFMPYKTEDGTEISYLDHMMVTKAIFNNIKKAEFIAGFSLKHRESIIEERTDKSVFGKTPKSWIAEWEGRNGPVHGEYEGVEFEGYRNAPAHIKEALENEAKSRIQDDIDMSFITWDKNVVEELEFAIGHYEKGKNPDDIEKMRRAMGVAYMLASPDRPVDPIPLDGQCSAPNIFLPDEKRVDMDRDELKAALEGTVVEKKTDKVAETSEQKLVVEEPVVATAPQSELNYPEELDKLVKDDQVTARVVSGLSDILREAGYTDEKTIEHIAEYLQDCVGFLENEYDSLSNPNMIRTMRQVTKEMFTSAYELMNESPIGLSVKDQVVAAQKLTNLMMRTYTLAAFDREQYGKYANDYVVSRKDVLEQRMKHFYGNRSQEEINSIIQDVQEAYKKPVNEEKKELDLHEQLKADTREKPVERSAKVAETQAPTKIQVKE